MKKVILTTRQNKKGNWWCSSEINSIERPTMDQAQKDMIEYHISQGYTRDNIKLEAPVPYQKKPQVKAPDLRYVQGNTFLDYKPFA